MKLHIGGTVRKEGWTVLNIVPGEHVDIVGVCTDLSMIPDNSCKCVYMSHVLEHLNLSERVVCLKEIFRVLEPGGVFYVGVPDMAALARLFLSSPPIHVKRGVNNILFGGEAHPASGVYNQHRYGYDEQLLADLLQAVGFDLLERRTAFNLFDDATKYQYEGVAMSLNMIFYKPKGSP